MNVESEDPSKRRNLAKIEKTVAFMCKIICNF